MGRLDAYPPTLGVILAGGQSRRLGGGDKPLREIGGRSLLAHAVARLQPQCVALCLSANGDPARFERLRLPVVADELAGFPGPLAGVLAALDWAAAEHPEVAWMVSAAGDTPFLPRDYVSRLHDARAREERPVACARSGDRTHPVNGLWPVSLRSDLRLALAEGERKVGRFAERHGVAIAEWPVGHRDPFFNVNTPAELAAAARMAGVAQEKDE